MMADLGIEQWIWHFIDACSRHGVFHCDAFKILLIRPVNSMIGIDDLNSLVDLDGITYPPEVANNHDAWHIIYAAGDIDGFFELAPYPLPKLIWQRDGRTPARIYNFNKLKERIYAKRTRSPT
tara:strand:+ start:297 stop:665 length:369 start_codon:yes stop_codon:yes gene_type:complete